MLKKLFNKRNICLICLAVILLFIMFNPTCIQKLFNLREGWGGMKSGGGGGGGFVTKKCNIGGIDLHGKSHTGYDLANCCNPIDLFFINKSTGFEGDLMEDCTKELGKKNKEHKKHKKGKGKKHRRSGWGVGSSNSDSDSDSDSGSDSD